MENARAVVFQPFLDPKPDLPIPVGRKALPIDEYREEILSSIAQNPLTVVIGETGCGKSSQIPIMILEVGCDLFVFPGRANFF